MDGTHRTSVKVKSTIRFCESRADSGRSPTATHGRGFPSTPDTVSAHGRMLRAWRSLRRAVRVTATSARGLEVMRKSMHAACEVFAVSHGATGDVSAATGSERCSVAAVSASFLDAWHASKRTGGVRARNALRRAPETSAFARYVA
eukprot:1546265-Pleurochrysis_carterae.AAC.2